MSQYFRKEILDSTLYQVKHEEGFKLNQNESPWDVPLELKVAITEKLLKLDWNRYPIMDPIVLKKKISKLNQVLPDQIILANGSNVLIQAVINATSHNSKVLILDPTFSVYAHQAELFGNKVIKIPLNEDFSLPVDKVLLAIKKEKPSLIFIANPNAPTGNLFDKQSLHRIVENAHCLTVIDEAYYPFSNETVVDWLKDFNHLVIFRTFSKAFALAGVRLGYAMGDIEVISQIEKTLLPFCLSRLTCAVAETVLDNPQYTDKFIKDILKEQHRLFVKMQEIANIKVYPSTANFFLFRVSDAKSVAQKLSKQGVIVRNVSDSGSLQNCLRVSVGTVDENDAFLKALRKVV